MIVVAFVSFSLFNFVGDPVNSMTGEDASDERRAEVREVLGLNDPVYVQFSRFIGNVIQGDFGISYQLKREVSDLIAERMPATLELVFVSALIAIISGVILGVYTGIHRDSFISNIILVISLAGVSLPTFIIGIMLIYLFSVILGVLPSFGRGEVTQLGFWTTGFLTTSGLKALILPSVTLSLFQMTYVIRLVRAEMMEILQTDYIKFAKARGIKRSVINYKHALKKWINSSYYYYRYQHRNVNCFFNYYRNSFSMARHGVIIYQSSILCRYSYNVSIYDHGSFYICYDKFYCRHHILFY